MTDQEKLMRQIYAAKFSAWELHIFLDTHPDNCDAAKMLNETQDKIAALTEQYESQYGPLHETSETTSRWAWITDPWPWDIGEGED
jgi:spore coat protein JB